MGGGGGGGGRGSNFQLLMLSPNLLKSQIPYMGGAGGGGKVKLPIAKIPNSHK